jgi:hypothetical protein
MRHHRKISTQGEDFRVGIVIVPEDDGNALGGPNIDWRGLASFHLHIEHDNVAARWLSNPTTFQKVNVRGLHVAKHPRDGHGASYPECRQIDGLSGRRH